MSIYDADFSDSLSAPTEDYTNHEVKVDWIDNPAFTDDYRVTDRPVRDYVDTFSYNETWTPSHFYIRSFSDFVHPSESYVKTNDIYHLKDTVTVNEDWTLDADFTDGELSDTVDTDDLFSRTLTSSPYSKILTDTVATSESYVANGSHNLRDSISVHDSWCLVVDVKVGWLDHVLPSESYYRLVNTFNDPRNNPVILTGGSGFTLIGNSKRILHDTVAINDRFVPVDEDGVPLNVDACSGVIIGQLVLHWMTLTEDQWDTMTEHQMMDMLE